MFVHYEILNDMLYEDTPEGYEKISDEIIELARWAVLKQLIFKHLESGKYYAFSYHEGSTEYQDVDPFDNADGDGNIKVTEVVPTTKTITVYENVNT